MDNRFETEHCLVHYASPYYDPQKAHEYYMDHRDLKTNRNSGVTLNEEGQKALTYVRKQLSDEKKRKTDEVSTNTSNTLKANSEKLKQDIESNTNATKAEIQNHANKVQGDIDTLKERLKHMSPKQKELSAKFFSNKINELKKENAEMRAKLTAQNQLNNANLRTQNKTASVQLRQDAKNQKAQIDEEYKKKLAEEETKIRNDAAFMKKAKTSKKKKS